jgi:threonine/homoserine/homoserine lactone efflux protein
MKSLAVIASLSFVVALSGAMAPGPLLTYTIVRTAQSRRRGFLVGAWVIAGHALLESALVVALLLGLSSLLRTGMVVRLIGALGGSFLVVMGVSLLRQLARGAATAPDVGSSEAAGPAQGPAIKPANPVLAGVLVSMSNPYWWIWWATVGFAFMVQNDITVANWPALLAFLAGHEAGDLAWYLTVSVLVSLGRSRINGRVYQAVLAACALVIVGFGLFLGVSSFLYRGA